MRSPRWYSYLRELSNCTLCPWLDIMCRRYSRTVHFPPWIGPLMLFVPEFEPNFFIYGSLFPWIFFLIYKRWHTLVLYLIIEHYLSIGEHNRCPLIGALTSYVFSSLIFKASSVPNPSLLHLWRHFRGYFSIPLGWFPLRLWSKSIGFWQSLFGWLDFGFRVEYV